MPPTRRIAAALLMTLLTAAGGCEDKAPAAGLVAVPSGREVRFVDVVTNAQGAKGAAARFRFVAPDITKDGSDAAADDMLALCNSYAVPRISGMVPQPQQIIISVSATEVPFGEAAPDVVQFFEAYSVKDGACIWDVF